jgi:Cu2+-exporting ATPase
MPATDAAPRTAARAARAPACAHCGLPVPAGLADHDPPFCCAGCATAWEVLRGCGLEGYYRLAERRNARVEPTGRGFEEFDHEAFHALYVKAAPGGLLETDLHLEGVHCASCVWLIERAPRLVPGLARAELNAPRALVRVAWDPAVVQLSGIARAMDTLGYRPHPFRGRAAEELRRREDRDMLARIGVAGALSGNIMMLAIATYAGWFGHMDASVEHYFRWWSLLLTTPSLFWPGRIFFRSAWAALRARTLHMDVPIALALAAGWGRGLVNTVTGTGPIYFDGVATLVFLLLVGRFLQQRAQRSAADASELMHALSPAVARSVDDDGRVREVPAEALLPGTLVQVRPGDTFPADGTITQGASDVDTSLLTGEPAPVAVGEGDAVYAGTVNRTSPLHVRIEQAGETSRLGRILREVEAGARQRAPVVLQADRFAGVFVAVVLALAAATWFAWSRIQPAAALDHAIALLVVTCPCALALATPLAMSVAIGRAARAGLLVKNGAALELLARPGTMYLDKTGTLTEGRVTLERWLGPDDVRAAVLALERHSAHPIATGFAQAWPGVPAPEASDVRQHAGGGLEGMVEGRRVVVGSPAFVAERAGGGAPAADDDAHTPVWVAVDGRVVARAGFGDRVRPDAASALAEQRTRGWALRILSGDAPAVVQRVGAALGFAPEDALGGLSPEDKQRVIAEAESHGRVVMAGDGINDAAAIARASVGIGVHGGAEACIAAADVYVARPGVAGLLALEQGARRTLGVIRRGIAFSLAYNLGSAALAVAGVINPLIAAVLMPASSLTVVLAAWWGRTYEPLPGRAAPRAGRTPA